MTSNDADIDDHVPTDDHDQSARADAPDPDPEPEPGRTVLTRRGMLFATGVAGLLGLGPSAAAASTNTGSGQIGTDATPLAKVITNQLNGADIQNATSGDVLESDGSGGLTFAAAGGGGTSPWEVDNNHLRFSGGMSGPDGIAVDEIRTDKIKLDDAARINVDSGLRLNELVIISGNGNGGFSFEGGLPDGTGDPVALDGSELVVDTSIGGGGGTTSVSSLVTSENSETGLEVFDANTAVSSGTSGNVNVVGGNADNNSNSEEVQGVTLFGSDNVAETSFSTVSGGSGNTAGNAASAFSHATVAGGEGNTASGIESFVGGGGGNTASGDQSAIPGGKNNTASGDATVCLGRKNTASAQYSIAIGNNAVAEHRGAVVIGDGNNVADGDIGATTSEAIEEFRVQASGGIHFQSGAKSQGKRVSPDIFIEQGLPGGNGNNVVIDSSTGQLKDADRSSARYKTNIEPLGTDTSGVLDLQPTAYEYEETGQADTGLIAEEVDEALPEIVNYDEEGRPDAVRYDRVGMFLAPEVSENRDRLETVEAAREECEETIETLETDLDAANARLEDQRDRIEHLTSTVAARDATIAACRAENERLEARLETVEAELGLGDTTSDRTDPGVADD
jgi:hypothetical protein